MLKNQLKPKVKELAENIYFFANYERFERDITLDGNPDKEKNFYATKILECLRHFEGAKALVDINIFDTYKRYCIVKEMKVPKKEKTRYAAFVLEAIEMSFKGDSQREIEIILSE